MYQNTIQLTSIDESLTSIIYDAKKRKGKKKTAVCTNLKQTSTKCGVYVVCRAMLGKCHIYKNIDI